MVINIDQVDTKSSVNAYEADFKIHRIENELFFRFVVIIILIERYTLSW